MLNNVKDFGACGDGRTDDRVAIQNAIANAMTFRQQAGIYFPAGVYRVGRVNIQGSGGCSLDLNNVRDFMVMGDGPRSVVQLMDVTSPGEWHAFLLRNQCHQVVFKDLVIDGNRKGLINGDQHASGIQAEAGTEDLVVDRCIVRNCFGDGLLMLRRNAPQPKVKRLRIENSVFQKNKRSGVVVQRGVAQVIIANCVFDANDDDNSIDIEPTDVGGPTDLIIHGCIINHTNQTEAVHLSGKSDGDPMINCKFTDNIVLGGAVFCVNVKQLTLQNNIIIVKTHIIPVEFHLGGESIIISGNLIITENASSEAVIALKGNEEHRIMRVLVSNNLCVAGSGSGITCSAETDGVVVDGNMIVAAGSCQDGIAFRADQGALENISIRNNDITVMGTTGKWDVGVRIASHEDHHIGALSITDNSIGTADTGVEFLVKNFLQTPVCSLNRVAPDVAIPLAGIGELPNRFLVVGGAMSRGGANPGSGAGRFIAGFGDPNTNVIGNVGDIFQRLDGGPGPKLYVKEQGNSTNLDWIAK